MADDNKVIVMLFSVEFNNVFDKIFVLSLPNIHHSIKSFKNVTRRNGYIDNILELKKKLCYDYIQNNVYPSQGVPKVFTYGPISAIDIVTHMPIRKKP